VATGQDAGVRTIRVAVLGEEPLGWGSGKHFFLMILQGYTWSVGQTRYRFIAQYVTDADILHGRLTTDSFDVLLVPGGGVGDGQSIAKGLWFSPRSRRWKRRIADYVKQGGGYVGICGGTALMTDLQTQRGGPRTFLERMYQNSAIGVSSVSSYYRSIAFPLLYPFQRNHPEDVGASAYVFSFTAGTTVDGVRVHTGGAPIGFRINTNHPVFAGASPVECIRWYGGPALVVPQHPDRNVQVLGWYPDVDLSRDPARRIFAWRYVGGLTGLKRAVWASLRLVKRERASLQKVFLYTYYLAAPWHRTDRVIDLDHGGRPAMTAEEYPNEHRGRILLCTAHPEYMRWEQGAIHERPDDGWVCIGSGFRQWEGVEPLGKLLASEVTGTWWMVRRFVAWAGKVPDDAMPPREPAVLSEEDLRRLEPYIVWDGSQANQFMVI
jgi:hypothetical protein